MKEGFAQYPSLENKTVLITGGASGIGASLVEHFAQQKARVAFFDITKDAGKELAAKVGAHFIHTDVRDHENLKKSVVSLAGEWGEIHALINNAANDDRHDWLEVDSAYFDDRIALNLKHAFFMSQFCVPYMKKGASIINMGSCSWINGTRNAVIYATAKSAIVGLTRTLAKELGERHIRVNCIQPGWIMTERQIKLWLTPEGEKEIFTNQCLPEKLYPEDISRMALWLAAEDSRLVSRQCFTVDGGWI